VSILNSSVGVDIGSTGVRAIQIKTVRGKIQIVKAGEVSLPKGVVVAGEVKDIESLTEAVVALWRKEKFTGKIVTVGMTGSKTMIRQVDLPWEPENVFREALPLRVGEDLLADEGEMTLDYYPLAEIRRGNNLIQRAMIVAAVNSAVENSVEALTSAKLKVKGADFAPFALIRAAAFTAGNGREVPFPQTDDEERDCEVVIDIGAQVTIVAIHDHGRPLFIRLVPSGSEAVTRAIAGKIGCSVEVAEAVKKVLGIPGIAGVTPEIIKVASTLPKESVPTAQKVITLMVNPLVQIARESIDYFLTQSPHITGVSRVLLSGGGALLPTYADRIKSEIKAPVGLLVPLNTFAVGGAEKRKILDPRMNIAFGLAMGAKE
jgi:type IV pilus assembly protein PilM